MKIAILGGGFTGLTAAYYLAKKRHQVTIFEKEKIFGGLAAGFKQEKWQWYLERTYHHLFANDTDILNFAKEVGFNKIFFKEPETASIYKISKSEILNYKPQSRINSAHGKQYENDQNSKQKSLENLNLENSCLFSASNLEFRIFPLDTPQDLLKFPLLSFPQKLQTGLVLAFLKFSPFFSLYERYTAKEFLKKTMGDDVWNTLWRQLFRKKFGKYAEIILASFIWARIKKRTKKLGYIEGGFQTFVNYLVKKLKSLQVNLLTSYEIKEIKKRGDKFLINNQIFDKIISTLPTPIMTKIADNIFPADFLQKLRKLEYLHALNLILETNEPLLDKTYWLNVSASQIPIMGIVQQTNFIDKKYYGGGDICYLAWYLDEKDKLWQMDKEQLLAFVSPYLKKINPNYSNTQLRNYFIFKAPFAQPIFDKDFVKNKPDFITPLKNFFIANLDMTYPYDRGTNYAVKLGQEVVKFIHDKKIF